MYLVIEHCNHIQILKLLFPKGYYYEWQKKHLHHLNHALDNTFLQFPYRKERGDDAQMYHVLRLVRLNELEYHLLKSMHMRVLLLLPNPPFDLLLKYSYDV